MFVVVYCWVFLFWCIIVFLFFFFCFQAEDGIRDGRVTEFRRVLFRSVGSFEGNCMKLQLEGIQTERPMTYELMLHALEAHGAQVVRAEVVRKVDSTFFAQLTTVSDGNERTLDCRPSDALNLALRAGAPIAVAQEVLDEVRADGETAST